MRNYFWRWSWSVWTIEVVWLEVVIFSVAEPEPPGANIFLLEPEPQLRAGAATKITGCIKI
jgi:hypothetical protein